MSETSTPQRAVNRELERHRLLIDSVCDELAELRRDHADVIDRFEELEDERRRLWARFNSLLDEVMSA